MVQMPTGTGKTHVLVNIVRQTVDETHGEVWIVAHRRELVCQIEDTVKLFGMTPYGDGHTDSNIRVMSIQWLTRHLDEMETVPALIVIDEAHHAKAKTYAAMMNAFPDALKLGVTATPCRLNRKGFTDLFDTLLCADSISWFISKGYLADFDYISLKPDCDDQRKINALTKRAADGDYSIAEMHEALDCSPSIERLYLSVNEFAAEKKGIVYGIDIEHAEHIAEYYREHGINAVAISCKTPMAERADAIRNFRDGKIRVLVNVDLFGEGFDCPDVEFIQLARPTLSLAKYLQMVGRGLRVADKKQYCVIIDNVGQYRLFGLPTAAWNWQEMFTGNMTGKGETVTARSMALAMSRLWSCDTAAHNDRKDMVVIARHDEPTIAILRDETEDFFRRATYYRKTKYGFLADGRYMRMEYPQGIYKTLNDVRMGWRLTFRMGKYYILNELNEKMVYVGHQNPWTYYAAGIVKPYYYLDGPFGVEESQRDITVKLTEYIIDGSKRKNGERDVCDVNGHVKISMPRFSDVSSDRKEYNTKDAFVVKKDGGGFAVCNNQYNVILQNLNAVSLNEDNLAEVTFMGEDCKLWVNLYTMQCFCERPEIVKVGFVEMLKVDNCYFFRKIRYMAGIPIGGDNIKCSDCIFQFMGTHIIRKEHPQQIIRLERGQRIGNRQYCKMMSPGINAIEEYIGNIDTWELPLAIDN